MTSLLISIMYRYLSVKKCQLLVEKQTTELKPGILLLIHPLGDRQGLENKAGVNGMTWAKAETKTSCDEGSEELPRSRRMKSGESATRAPAFYESIFISIILFVHFLLVNTFFPILCGFTHVSF